MQSSKYFSSLVGTASVAFWHSSLGSVQPASLHSLATKEQHSATSFWSRATLFVRTRRHSSLASMHVRMCLNLLRVRSRILWRVSSKLFFSRELNSRGPVISFLFLLYECLFLGRTLERRVVSR